MTDKELHRLRRTELLEILLYLQKEVDSLQQENETLRQQLETASSHRKCLEEILETVQRTEQRIEGHCPKSSASDFPPEK